MNISVLQPFLNFTAAMAIVSWIRVLPGDLSNLYALLDETSTVEAHRCAINFSAKEIIPFVTDGVYKEDVLQEVTRPDNVQFLDNMVGPRKYFVHTQDNWDPLIFRLPGLYADRENMFTVPSSAFTPIYSQLVDDLKGQVTIASRIYSNSTTIYMLYKANSVVQSIQNMADAITTEMRRNGSSVNPQQTIQGLVWIQQQFVVVRWAWLALPATMLVLTSLFLAATIVETRRKDVGVWLSSPLVLFFNARLDSSGKDVLSDASSKSLNTADGMVRVAAGLKASIVKGSHTIHVVAKEPVKTQDGDFEMESLRRLSLGPIETSMFEDGAGFAKDLGRTPRATAMHRKA
ncbi:hypothetical protein CGCTS75_v002497 [Colletotrichum tropicale]|nr:hypothetical protein CGCTS75_v002497 [Colletotrichum tropicale]